MKYVSIDIETGGLGRDCSLLEFGAVVDDLANPRPFDELPTFHTYFLNDRIIGEPYALAMHQKIIQRISRQEVIEGPFRYMKPESLEAAFFNFLTGPARLPVVTQMERKDRGGGVIVNSSKPDYVEIVVAGKNFMSFDINWLQPLFTKHVKFHRRVLDPAILFFQKGEDKVLPDSKLCMKRAGLEGEVAHTAVEDAMMVCKLLRKHFCP